LHSQFYLPEAVAIGDLYSAAAWFCGLCSLLLIPLAVDNAMMTDEAANWHEYSLHMSW
jgi:hypothetical protein